MLPSVEAQLRSALATEMLTHCDAEEVLRRAAKYQNHLQQLQAAAKTNQTKKLRAPIFNTLNSFEGRFWAVVQTAQRRKMTITQKDAETHAETLDVFKPSCEPILSLPRKKPEGGIRNIFAFGRERAARQHLCANALRAMNVASPYSYGFRGRGGQHDAVGRVFELRQQGYDWVVVADIANCYDSLGRKGVKERLHPFPWKVVDCSIALSAEHVLMENAEGNMTSLPAEATKKLGRLGAPQGAITSGLVASACLAPELDALAKRGQVVCHGDDLLIATKSKEDALATRQELETLLAKHPAGPLSLKHCRVKSGQFGYGFDFLQYHFEEEDPYFGHKFRARPAKSAFGRLQARLIKTYLKDTTLNEETRATQARDYAFLWRQSFSKYWDQNPHNYDLFLYTIEEALALAVDQEMASAA